MSASEHSELRELIHGTFEAMGGTGTKSEVMEMVRGRLPQHLTDYLVTNGLSTAVGTYFRSTDTDSGLPVAPEVDACGTHMFRELMSVDEYRFAIRRRMSGARAYSKRAQQFADECAEVHGVVIDIDAEGRRAS